MPERPEVAASEQYRYLTAFISVFLELREDSQKIIERYQRRLISLAIGPDVDDSPATAVSSGNLATRLLSVSSLIAVWLSRTPAYLRQYRSLKKAISDGRFVVIASSSRRLLGSTTGLNAREYLSRLANVSFAESPSSPNVSHEIEQAKSIILFEPESISPLRNSTRRLEGTGLYICDGHFLIFVAIWCLLQGKARSFHRAVLDLRVDIGRKHLWTGALVFDAYRDLFDCHEKFTSYFFTSNSYFTEILRCFLLQAEKSKSVCEIMHGAPTTVYERFLKDMLEVGAKFGSYEKHSSIGLVPELPPFGVLVSDCKLPSNYAINTYLNRYLIENATRADGLAANISSRAQTLFGGFATESDVLVVTFIGGMSMGKGFFESGLFDAERQIIDVVIEVLNARDRKFVVVYSPHPGHPKEIFEAHPYFAGNPHVSLYANTVFSWFVSDISLSLFSGAIFEAVYFGSKTFAPMQAEDDFYPQEMLDWVGHQTTQSNYQVDLRKFVEDCSSLRTPRIMDKIVSRIGKLNSDEILNVGRSQ